MRPRKQIDPVAWLLWLIAISAIPLTSRHPLYLALALLVVIVVHLSIPTDGGRASPWRFFAYVGSSVAVLSIGFNVLTVHSGDRVICRITGWLADHRRQSHLQRAALWRWLSTGNQHAPVRRGNIQYGRAPHRADPTHPALLPAIRRRRGYCLELRSPDDSGGPRYLRRPARSGPPHAEHSKRPVVRCSAPWKRSRTCCSDERGAGNSRLRTACVGYQFTTFQALAYRSRDSADRHSACRYWQLDI